MSGISLWIPILIAAICIFMFYTSGVTILELLKFNIKNPFASIAAGFFAFFTYISILTFPLQLISVLPYVFFVYYLWGLTIVYIIFCFIFTKYWLSLDWFWKHFLIFAIVVAVVGGSTYFQFINLADDNFARHKNMLSILSWLKDNQVSFFNNATLFKFLGFKPFQGWYTFQLAVTLLFNTQSYQFKDIIVPFTFILDIFLTSSIFIFMFDSFHKLQSARAYKKYSLMGVSLFIFTGTKTAFLLFGNSFWLGDTIFIYLIFYVMILGLRYTGIKYRERSNPIFIGTVLGGYISFSWDNSYQVLFIIYCLLFLVQRRYRQNFTKDILKLSLFPIIDLVFFNIILGYYIQTTLFLAILLLLFIVIYIMSKNYSNIIKFETFVDDKINWVTLILPVVFMGVSIAITLGSNQSLISAEDTYLNFLYDWTAVFSNVNLRFWITSSLAMFILAISFLWIFIRKKFNTSILTGMVDLLLINYLTFYNPIVVKFINLIYPMMLQSNGIIIIIQGAVLLNVIIYWLFNRSEDKKNISEIKIIRNYNWLKI
ncbi:hypothetical protein SHELI_v1c01180 [Spiroplasma helicoides]|uniref:Uncharacterized protein n=1 Tax=Spiroplasma helicoides TaxID=216938 RepID=A0A1B3SJG3_9MOLU|nr:hypothetical protein [Spiroplasma helicoides]AOG60073.1 hypothetical protein SHELI_v1c01180 [Spiroplasma helicoides]